MSKTLTRILFILLIMGVASAYAQSVPVLILSQEKYTMDDIMTFFYNGLVEMTDSTHSATDADTVALVIKVATYPVENTWYYIITYRYWTVSRGLGRQIVDEGRLVLGGPEYEIQMYEFRDKFIDMCAVVRRDIAPGP